MTIEDVADKADAWSEAIKKIIKAISAAAVALVTAIAAVVTLWPSSDSSTPPPPPPAAVSQGMGYGPQCSQLYNTIEHTWTESQWTVWESLKRDLGC
jgi:hypothetical protein|tara:strand:- start:209 stop:499 length:291 start_codon:yes stop_codon:yes gene_type:complete